MSDADLFEDRVKLLFDTRLEELLEKINSEYPDPVYREEIIDKGADLIEQKKAFEEKLNALENDEYKKSHDRIMKTIKSEFQEAKDLTDQEMYKKARAYNKKFTIWKETSKTMEDLDNQLLLDKKMKEKINNFIGMVQSDIDGRQLDISGKSFLQGVLDKDAENAKLEQENANLISKHTRELAEKDREKDAAVAQKQAELVQKQAELVQKQAELAQKQAELAQKQKDMLRETAFKSLSFEKVRKLTEETIKLKEEIQILEENCEENIYEEVVDPVYNPNAFGQKKDKQFNPLYDPNAFGQFDPLYDPNAFGQKKDKQFNPLYDPNAFGQFDPLYDG